MPCHDSVDPYKHVWEQGYSIAELWGYSAAVTRATSHVDGSHVLLWGILSIVEYQVDRGAGHRYLRDRLWSSDWVAIGYRAPKTVCSRLARVPQIRDAQFGRRVSAIGTDEIEYHDVRIVHGRFLADLTLGEDM